MLVQAEAYVEPQISATGARFLTANGLSAGNISSTLSSSATIRAVREALSQADDRQIRSIKWNDYWFDGEPIRQVTVVARRGVHTLDLELLTGFVNRSEYREFPKADPTEFSLDTQVYPVYEEHLDAGGSTTPMTLVNKPLKHILKNRPSLNADPFIGLRNRRYFYSQLNELRGSTPEGQAQGFWSMDWLKARAEQLVAQAPTEPNDFSAGYAVLRGRYATVNLHPDAITSFRSQISFIPQLSPTLFTLWREVQGSGGQPDYEVIPSSGFYGKPLQTAAEALSRSRQRDAQHDPAFYINQGFDEIQVYYAVTELFEQLHRFGFSDPELSTRAFNAYLYDPDIGMKDNAYYTNDTINFTTYSPRSLNYARDNSTIWHELGHGVMDRLMGDHLKFADTGGLSEGMADFIAELVLKASWGQDDFPGYSGFRIINSTNFYLSNEVHDDGEAYGGAMRDILVSAQNQFGASEGLAKITDLTLEAMRLTRDHPALTAEVWFRAMLFADSLGRPQVRAPGELSNLVSQALGSRNFRLDGGAVAKFTLVNGNTGAEVLSSGPGSRGQPLAHTLRPDQSVDYVLQVRLQSSDRFQFHYPLKIRAEYRKGALQGAIHWKGEENGPLEVDLAREADTASLPVQASGRCDFSNRDDGSCVDYVYVQVIDPTRPSQPLAKKRFYLRIRNP